MEIAPTKFHALLQQSSETNSNRDLQASYLQAQPW